MLPQRSTRHRGRRERRQQRQAAWMFLIACFVVYVLMLAFAPDGLRVSQHRALGVSYSVLIAFLGYFACGSTKVVAESEKSGLVKVGICVFVAFLAGGGMYLLWEAGLAPVQRLIEQ